MLTPLSKKYFPAIESKSSSSTSNRCSYSKHIYIYIYVLNIYIYGLDMTTLIISNEEMKDMMEIVKSLEQSGLLEKGVSETNENEEKINKKVDFLICY